MEVQLEANEFFDLCENLMEIYDWIERFSDHMYHNTGGLLRNTQFSSDVCGTTTAFSARLWRSKT